MAELDAGGTLQATNTFGPQGLVSRCTAATNRSVFYTFDERGNVAQRLDAGGNVLSTDLYDAFGARTGTAPQNTAPASDPWGFGAQWGEQTDTETGLVLCTNRFYDPQQGRFLTRDPLGYDGGVNLYGYVENDPVNWGDPSGLIGGPGKGGPIPGWKPPVKSPPVPRPGWHSGKTGSDRGGDYYALNYSIGFPFLAWNGQVERDRYGDWYTGNGGGFGTAGFSFSLVEGELNQRTTPSKKDLQQWMKGPGLNVTAAYGLSMGETYSLNANNDLEGANECGIGSPQAGGSAIGTSLIHDPAR